MILADKAKRARDWEHVLAGYLGAGQAKNRGEVLMRLVSIYSVPGFYPELWWENR